MTKVFDHDKVPPWPVVADGWDASYVVNRRTDALRVGSLVFIDTDERVYIKKNGQTGSPLHRWRYELFAIADQTRVSWLLASWPQSRPDSYLKVPKRDLSRIFGRLDVEDVLWVGANQHSIAEFIGRLRDRAKLEQIAAIAGFTPKAPT